MTSKTFDRLSFWAVFLIVVLLPVFFLPFTRVSTEVSKGLLLVSGLAVCLVAWSIARFLDGKIILPKSWLLVSGISIPVVFLASALFASPRQVSLFGSLFDIGSFWFILAAFLLMLVSSLIFRTPKQAKILLLGVILSSAILLVFQVLNIFLPQYMSLGVLGGKTGSILGSWNALGLFAGFSALMFLLVIEFFPISKVEKIFLEVMILIALFLTAAVNFPMVWVLLGVSSLIIFAYKSSRSLQGEDDSEHRTFPALSFAIVIISLLFFTSGQLLGNFLPSKLKLTSLEVSPTLSATIEVTKNVIMKDPVLGIGPNKFGEAWALYKPASINVWPFWNVPFESGSGFFPTLAATTGVLGILVLTAFLVLFLVVGIRSVFKSIQEGVNWEMVAFFVLSLYLAVSLFFYPGGSVIFLISLAFMGVFIGLSSGDDIVWSFLNDHRKSFFSILCLIFLVIFSITTTFKYLERFTSAVYFGKAVTAATPEAAETNINKAISLYSNDLYLRTYSQIYLLKLGALSQKSSLTSQEKTTLQNSFKQAINSAQLAVQSNPSNYVNYQALGAIYQSMGMLGVGESYKNAVLSYKAAEVLNPGNPGIKIAIANALIFDGKLSEAREYANKALALKPNYVEAYITLSQISKRAGNTSEAVQYGKQALAFDPNNKNLVQYVNALSTSSSTPPAPTTTNSSTTTTR